MFEQTTKKCYRIAPSPTGMPHVGTCYIAVFNWLLAKKNNGKLILRIEDTDRSRSDIKYENAIIDGFKWIGIEWDQFYKQSTRLKVYQEYCDILLKKGCAYMCNCSEERLIDLRKSQILRKVPTKYDGHCREKNINEGVVRLKVPDDIRKISFYDSLRGEIVFDLNQIDDQILLKSDMSPTYHLANVVDDYLMGITDVIRAEEWINSTPKHVLMYDMFGWKQPNWIHLPLLKKSDGGKISKRLNDRSIFYYKQNGYLPISLVNMFILLGMKHLNNIEKMDIDMIFNYVDVIKFSTNSPVFDEMKLKWLNREHIQTMETSNLIKNIEDFVEKKYEINQKYFIRIINELKKSEYTLKDISDQLSFFCEIPNINFKKLEIEKTIKICSYFIENFDFDILNKICQNFQFKKHEIAKILRLILIGKEEGTAIKDIIYMIGEQESIKRIKRVLNMI